MTKWILVTLVAVDSGMKKKIPRLFAVNKKGLSNNSNNNVNNNNMNRIGIGIYFC